MLALALVLVFAARLGSATTLQVHPPLAIERSPASTPHPVDEIDRKRVHVIGLHFDQDLLTPRTALFPLSLPLSLHNDLADLHRQSVSASITSGAIKAQSAPQQTTLASKGRSRPSSSSAAAVQDEAASAVLILGDGGKRAWEPAWFLLRTSSYINNAAPTMKGGQTTLLDDTRKL